MYVTYHFKERLRLFLSLFLPILIYQLANYSASFVDTAMTGQYRTLDLAGVSTATSLWNPFFTFLTGIVSALTPIVGHHLGKGNKERIAGDFYQFLYLSFGMAILLIGFQADRLRKCCCSNSHSLLIFPFSRNLTFVAL